MRFFQIISFFILLIFINPSIDCFFIPNPINWFRRPATELSENQTDSTVSSLEPTININDSLPTQTTEELFQTPINQIQPSQPLPTNGPFLHSDRPIDPLSLSKHGIPIKINRFGLEPLPYPLKTGHSKFQMIPSGNINSLSNNQLFRRIGELPETTTQMPLIDETDTENEFNVQTNPSEDYSTLTSTQSLTTQSDVTEKVDENYNLFNESKFITEATDSEDISPTPVYMPTSPATDEIIIKNTTPKPTFLHNEEFANLLNNMYYQRSNEMFEPMMEKFNGRALQ